MKIERAKHDAALIEGRRSERFAPCDFNNFHLKGIRVAVNGKYTSFQQDSFRFDSGKIRMKLSEFSDGRTLMNALVGGRAILIAIDWCLVDGSVDRWEMEAFVEQCDAVAPEDIYQHTTWDVAAAVVGEPQSLTPIIQTKIPQEQAKKIDHLPESEGE